MFFKKKNEIDFEVTKTCHILQYDKNHNLIRYKNGLKTTIIPVEDIDKYTLSYEDGYVTEGKYTKKYVKNVWIRITTKSNKLYPIPVFIFKTLEGESATRCIKSAEEMIKFLDEVIS